MIARKIVAGVCMGLMCVALVNAQRSTDGAAEGETKSGNLTIEDLYLTQEIEIQLLRSQAGNNNLDSKLLALQDIRSMVESGKVSESSQEVLLILDGLAGEGVSRIVTNAGAVTNDFPQVRREAIALLGRVGGRAARSTILRALNNDKEDTVRAEAVYALGVSAGTDNGDAIPFIARVLHNNTQRLNPDFNLAHACLLAIEKISEKQGGVADPDIILAVVDVAFSKKYNTLVERKAEIVLRKLRGR
jgi:hypothetical protein